MWRWLESANNDYPPPPPMDTTQKAWGIPHVQATYDSLLDRASNPKSRDRLLAVATKEFGAWLNALPISRLGLRMDDKIIRIAVGLRLGAPLCHPHRCCLCGTFVDSSGTHGLSSMKSQGRHSRHAEINSIILRSLSAAKILEPTGLCTSDGK